MGARSAHSVIERGFLMEFQTFEEMVQAVSTCPNPAEIKKINTRQNKYIKSFENVEPTLEMRTEMLAQLIEAVSQEDFKIAPMMLDIRIRDGFIRSVWDISQLPDSDTELADIIAGLLVLATASTGEVRGQCLTLWVGFHFMLGNLDAFSAVQGLPEVEDISLFQLLSIAHSHGVPSSVWGASLEAVSLEACLTGVG